MQLDSFTLETYRELLGTLAADRRCLCFGDFEPPAGQTLRLRDGTEPPERFLILRHDVDFSPAGALRLARIEAAMDLRATYFLPLTIDAYNLLCPRWRTLPRALADLGHEVGLHYDVTVFESEPARRPLEHLREQVYLLSGLSGRAVTSIAMHNPSLSGTDPFRGSRDFVNAYEPAFTRGIAYYSESCGAWRDAAHAALTSGRAGERVQLLTHPVYWAEAPGDRRSRLDDWIGEQKAELERLRDLEEEIWTRHTGVAEHEGRRARGGADGPVGGR